MQLLLMIRIDAAHVMHFMFVRGVFVKKSERVNSYLLFYFDSACAYRGHHQLLCQTNILGSLKLYGRSNRRL